MIVGIRACTHRRLRYLQQYIQTVKDAFKAVLRANPLLPSFLVWDERASEFSADNHALHVTLKPSEKLFDQVLQDGGSVEKVEDLIHLAWNHPHPEWTLCPGILFRVLLFKVETTKSVGFVVSGKALILSSESSPQVSHSI